MRLDSMSLALDRVDATFKREDLSVQSLFDLGQSLNPLREELQAKIAELEPRLAQVDARLKQLGPAPAQGGAARERGDCRRARPPCRRARHARRQLEAGAPAGGARRRARRADHRAPALALRPAIVRAVPERALAAGLAGCRQSLRRGAGPARRADAIRVGCAAQRGRPHPWRAGGAHLGGARYCHGDAVALVAAAHRRPGDRAHALHEGAGLDRRVPAYRFDRPAGDAGGDRGARGLPAVAGSLGRDRLWPRYCRRDRRLRSCDCKRCARSRRTVAPPRCTRR